MIHKRGIGYEEFDCINKIVRSRSTVAHFSYYVGMYYITHLVRAVLRLRARDLRRPADLQDGIFSRAGSPILQCYLPPQWVLAASFIAMGYKQQIGN